MLVTTEVEGSEEKITSSQEKKNIYIPPGRRRIASGEDAVISFQVEGSGRGKTRPCTKKTNNRANNQTNSTSPGRRRTASGEGVVVTIEVYGSGRGKSRHRPKKT